MSEKLRLHEQEPGPEVGMASPEDIPKEMGSTKSAEKLDLSEARAAIEKAKPITKETFSGQAEMESDAPSDVRWWSKELGHQTFDRTLSSVRRQLTAPEKQLSKFIHKPVIEKTSDFVGKTVARPSGILLGGIFSFVGSLGVYLMARYLGGEIRYSIFAVTFVGGYLLGLIVELAWRLLTRKKTS